MFKHATRSLTLALTLAVLKCDLFCDSFHTVVCSYGKRPHWNRSRTSRHNPHHP